MHACRDAVWHATAIVQPTVVLTMHTSPRGRSVLPSRRVEKEMSCELGLEDLISRRSRSDLSDLSTGGGCRNHFVRIGLGDLLSLRSRSVLSDLSAGGGCTWSLEI